MVTLSNETLSLTVFIILHGEEKEPRMQQSSSFELSWSNLIDLWNESSYEKGADLSFKEIVILESFAEEGVEPCQGFDWLSCGQIGRTRKPKRRTISYSFGKYTAHVAQSTQGILWKL